jgi:hypothetical protein
MNRFKLSDLYLIVSIEIKNNILIIMALINYNQEPLNELRAKA